MHAHSRIPQKLIISLFQYVQSAWEPFATGRRAHGSTHQSIEGSPSPCWRRWRQIRWSVSQVGLRWRWIGSRWRSCQVRRGQDHGIGRRIEGMHAASTRKSLASRSRVPSNWFLFNRWQVVGNSLKSLEVSEEKANQRVEEFKREMKTLTVRLKEAENRAEQAEKQVKRLQKEVDRLEGTFKRSRPIIFSIFVRERLRWSFEWNQDHQRINASSMHIQINFYYFTEIHRRSLVYIRRDSLVYIKVNQQIQMKATIYRPINGCQNGEKAIFYLRDPRTFPVPHIYMYIFYSISLFSLARRSSVPRKRKIQSNLRRFGFNIRRTHRILISLYSSINMLIYALISLTLFLSNYCTNLKLPPFPKNFVLVLHFHGDPRTHMSATEGPKNVYRIVAIRFLSKLTKCEYRHILALPHNTLFRTPTLCSL